MNCLVIFAHPNHNSFNGEILKKVATTISEKNEVKILDLYAENFNPSLYFDDDQKRRNMHLDPSTKKERELIEWADQLTFIFPIWWSGMPAILKGFIDRVFAKNFAYVYKGIRPVGLLRNKRAWIITTHDTPAFYVKLVQQDYGKVLKNQVLKMCGIKPVKQTSCTYLRASSEKKRRHFLQKIEQLSERI